MKPNSVCIDKWDFCATVLKDDKNMNPEGVIEAIFGTFVIIILVYAFTDVILTLQGPLWAIIFVLASILIIISYIGGEL